jgi:hypothetical protein
VASESLQEFIMSDTEGKNVVDERIEIVKVHGLHQKGVHAEQLEINASFAAKDEEWHAYKTKQLLRKVDTRLLPILILVCWPHI